ncbi:hypothetical protein [Pseudomonas mandelii]|uniref:hypothetical protein n=1 Tax=Pseudomonas mandelii TaxID=75612 RepID=UPI0012DBDC97|nr:hypothetical protein [Pseudomonas mandelii]
MIEEASGYAQAPAYRSSVVYTELGGRAERIFLCSDRVNRNIFSEGPLKFFSRDGSLYLRTTKSSDLGTPLSADPAEETVLVFASCRASASGLFLRWILLTLMCDCPVGIAKSPLRGVSRCFPV